MVKTEVRIKNWSHEMFDMSLKPFPNTVMSPTCWVCFCFYIYIYVYFSEASGLLDLYMTDLEEPGGGREENIGRRELNVELQRWTYINHMTSLDNLSTKERLTRIEQKIACNFFAKRKWAKCATLSLNFLIGHAVQNFRTWTNLIKCRGTNSNPFYRTNITNFIHKFSV